MKHVPPLEIRELRAMMALKNLSLRDVSAASGVGYSVASAVLTGRTIYPAALAKLRKVIQRSAKPEEVAA